MFMVLCLQCRPLDVFWDDDASGTCIDIWLFNVISSAINSFMDFIILFVPIRPTWNLNLPKAQKIPVIAIFSLGSL